MQPSTHSYLTYIFHPTFFVLPKLHRENVLERGRRERTSRVFVDLVDTKILTLCDGDPDEREPP